jgi:hypothetical protein
VTNKSELNPHAFAKYVQRFFPKGEYQLTEAQECVEAYLLETDNLDKADLYRFFSEGNGSPSTHISAMREGEQLVGMRKRIRKRRH